MTSFRDLFGCEPTVQTEAPGRVNLIGEHTDYNGGFVLPAALPQRTRVRLAVHPGSQVRAASTSAQGVHEFTLGREQKGRGWLDYIQGATSLLAGAGHRLEGFDLFVDSDVPVGSGLSSSAALGIALLRSLRQAFALPLDDLQIARLWQQVENRFVGAQVGIMDPMACALAAPGTALFLDAQSLRHEVIPLPAGIDWVVINSGVAHDHVAGDYNTRRAECERACSLLGISSLRELSEAELPRTRTLPSPLGRRARHVITENARVLAAVEALRHDDRRRLGQLFNASHDSQRDDYEVSIPAIEVLVSRARLEPGVYGVRLTGGGFGGSVVLFTDAGRGSAIAARLVGEYATATGHRPAILVPQPVSD